MNNKIFVELPELLALRRHAIKNDIKAKSIQKGLNSTRMRGRGMEFAEVRNYQPLDEIRHMEWRVTARTGKAHVKLFEEEKEIPVIIFTDFSSSMFFGTKNALKWVIAAHLSALIVWSTIKQGDKIGGFFFNDENYHEFKPNNKEHGILPLLQKLADCTKTQHKVASDSFNNALKRVSRVIKPGSILILISDFYQFDKESIKHLSYLKQNTDIIAYHVCDPLELKAPVNGIYPLTNGTENLILNTKNQAMAKEYQAYCDAKIVNLKKHFQTLQINYNQITGANDLTHVLRQTLMRKKRNA